MFSFLLNMCQVVAILMSPSEIPVCRRHPLSTVHIAYIAGEETVTIVTTASEGVSDAADRNAGKPAPGEEMEDEREATKQARVNDIPDTAGQKKSLVEMTKEPIPEPKTALCYPVVDQRPSAAVGGAEKARRDSMVPKQPEEGAEVLRDAFTTNQALPGASKHKTAALVNDEPATVVTYRAPAHDELSEPLPAGKPEATPTFPKEVEPDQKPAAASMGGGGIAAAELRTLAVFDHATASTEDSIVVDVATEPPAQLETALSEVPAALDAAKKAKGTSADDRLAQSIADAEQALVGEAKQSSSTIMVVKGERGSCIEVHM